MKSIIRAGLLTLATVPALAAHAAEQICNATLKTVVFDYRPPASDPFLQKLFDKTKAMTGSSPDEILTAYFGKDQYEVLSRDFIVVTANSQLNWSEGLDNDTPIAVRGKTGKIEVITSHTGWRYKYYAVPIEGSVRTALTVERFVATPGTGKPLTLTDKWLATAGQNHIQTLGDFKNSYSFLTQLVGTDCH